MSVNRAVRLGGLPSLKRDYCWLFTDATIAAFAEDERDQIIESMFEVAYADGEVHDLELGIARRVADLLGMSDAEFDAAK